MESLEPGPAAVGTRPVVLRNLLEKCLKDFLGKLVERAGPSGQAAPALEAVAVRALRSQPWWEVYERVHGGIAELPSQVEVRRFLADVEPYATYWRDKQWLIWAFPESADDIVAALLTRVIVDSQGAPLDEIDWAGLDEGVASLEAALSASTWKMRLFCPIEGFGADLDNECVELSQQVRIAAVTAEEQRTLGPASEGDWEEGFPDWAIKVDFEMPKDRGPGEVYYPRADAAMAAAYQEAELVVSCLRLLHGGECAAHRAFTLRLLPDPIRATRSGWSPFRHFAFDPYDLTETDRSPLIQLFQALKGLDGKAFSSLRVAVERFRLAQDRPRQEDRLIDLCIAAEALFVKGEGQSEKSLRIALTAAWQSSSNEDDRKKTYDLFSDAFRVRNKIVHGGTARMPTGRETMANLVEEFGDTLQKLLHWAVLEAASGRAVAGSDARMLGVPPPGATVETWREVERIRAAHPRNPKRLVN